MAPPFVMMVDDDKCDAWIVRKAFERGKNEVEFRHLAGGRQLLGFLDAACSQTSAASNRLPDVILLDINMPEMNGFQVLRALRDDPRNHHLPITMLSTSSQPNDVFRSYQQGANSYIVKPGSVAGMRDFVESFHAFWFKLVQLPGLEARRLSQ
jgi:CheY-like chemotaxis protein